MKELPNPITLIIDGYNWSLHYSNQVETMQIVLFAQGQAISSFNHQINDDEAKAAGYTDEYYNSLCLSLIENKQQ